MPFILLLTSLLAFVRSSIIHVKTWLTNTLLDILATGPMPRHISFVMDGNRRYARKVGKEVGEGHRIGFDKMCQVLELCLRLRIRCVTVYAFSIGNFNRPKDEVDTIMKLAEDRLVEIAQNGEILHRHGVRLNVLGRRELLPETVQVAIAKAENMTRHNSAGMLNICAAYASQDEITTAVESVIQKAIDTGDLDGRLLSTITEDSIASQLSTSLAGSPPLDIFVRTSGVKRSSGFLLWQCSENTQIHMVDRYWPEFGLFDLLPILLEYQRKVWADEKRCSVGSSSTKRS